MKKCISRKISLLKKKKLFYTEYEIVEIETHSFVSESVELFKSMNNQYVSQSNSKIFCIHCGEIAT